VNRALYSRSKKGANIAVPWYQTNSNSTRDIGGVSTVAIAAIAVLVFTIYLAADKQQYDAKVDEGSGFGKTTDQLSCMQEGLARAKKMTGHDISQLTINQAFVEECLKTSRPTVSFCDGVPSMWKLSDSEWEQKQCEKIGLDVLRTGCRPVFAAKESFCRF
jgi:hypothetical protein